MGQNDFFGEWSEADRVPVQSHSKTSRQAGKEIKLAVGTLRSRVLAFLLQRGEHGATDGEMQAALSMNPSTQRPRRIELVNAGLVKDSGVKRKTESGRSAVVWVAVFIVKKESAQNDGKA